MAISQGPVSVAMATHSTPVHPEKTSSIVSENNIQTTPTELPDKERYIVVSPYTEQQHLLDLTTLDPENQILALALSQLTCLREDYATAPYRDTFNWDQIIEHVRALARKRNYTWKETSFFVVAFRSQVFESTVENYADLGELDKAAHAEATASGGFLKYWFGTPNEERRNLATCIWRSPEDAKKGGTGPAHRKAAGATRSLYSFWHIDRHRLTIRDNVESWDLTEWN
ncbi:hypothetical protein NEUTE1DRAFT_40568 [Neurospora tetrasperma FGSC 2508]|uniref:Uncharacterized protein n=1 Tax=Neurospora tetrasperma (strain FGSC 2508 / ATCC MYA-4615 / P0657) TaxID=510951 RepID=F8MHK6_NEUT8|nr:uncharacterized protein NEUTE1DRAFT_40568 [Neurospora tetrasperma FGSC 2508]EGO58818.1 hypothetical protein NEUTE1DRAFT_40568 [Neurospora tetrasperma FGSC 2508]EGZ72919.1 hypothetical protein NEUTE2DRAFT_127272 [Neurospora tetrasperma FGSC 2509]